MGTNVEEIKIEVQQTGAEKTRKQLEEVEKAQKKIQSKTIIGVHANNTKKAVNDLYSAFHKQMNSNLFNKRKNTSNSNSIASDGGSNGGGGGGGDNTTNDNTSPFEEAGRKSKQFSERLSKSFNTLYESTKPLTRATTKLSNFFRRTFGEIMMFVGALMMVRNMAQRLYNTLVVVGNKFSDIEKKALVASAYREKLYTKHGLSEMHEFERATQRRAVLTGESMAEAGMNLARAASELEENGGTFSEKALNQLTEASFGSSALTGEEHLKVMKDILKIAREGKGTEKLGIGNIKLTKNIDENIRRIANEVKSNHIADAVIKYSTVGASVKSMGSSFDDLFDTVFHLHKTQISESFATAARNMRLALTDPEVVEVFEHLVTNLTDVMDKVFDKDRLKDVAIGSAQWGAILIDAGGKLADAIMWTFENSEKVLEYINLAVKVWAIFKTIQFFAFTGETIVGLLALKNGISDFIKILSGKGVVDAVTTLTNLAGASASVATAGAGVAGGASVAGGAVGAGVAGAGAGAGMAGAGAASAGAGASGVATGASAGVAGGSALTVGGVATAVAPYAVIGGAMWGLSKYIYKDVDRTVVDKKTGKKKQLTEFEYGMNMVKNIQEKKEAYERNDMDAFHSHGNSEYAPYFPDPDESILNKSKFGVDVVGNSYMSPSAKVILVNGNLGIMTDSPELENYILQNGGE